MGLKYNGGVLINILRPVLKSDQNGIEISCLSPFSRLLFILLKSDQNGIEIEIN